MPSDPLVGVCFARTFYIDTSISATNGLSTSYLLPTPLHTYTLSHEHTHTHTHLHDAEFTDAATDI